MTSLTSFIAYCQLGLKKKYGYRCVILCITHQKAQQKEKYRAQHKSAHIRGQHGNRPQLKVSRHKIEWDRMGPGSMQVVSGDLRAYVVPRARSWRFLRLCVQH